jgi:hypothetical protein
MSLEANLIVVSDSHHYLKSIAIMLQNEVCKHKS